MALWGGRLDRAFSFRAIPTTRNYSTLHPHGNYGLCGGRLSTGVSISGRFLWLLFPLWDPAGMRDPRAGTFSERK
jgi:hypothetical protein